MPLSRGRKNKKKKKPLSQKKSKDYEEFNAPGVNVVRDGKNIYIKTNRSPREQKELEKKIKENRPKILEYLKSSIDRVTEIFSTYNKFQLLGVLAYNLVAKDKDLEDDGAAELALEYGLSFATATAGNQSLAPTGAIGNELIGNLYDIRKIYAQYIMSEFVDSTMSETENHLRFKTITESLYMRGDGYPQHIYLVFEELFSGHDNFLSTKYGFTSKDILETFLQLEDSFCCRVLSPDGVPHRAAYERFKEWYQSKGLVSFLADDQQPMIDFLAENPDIFSEDQKPSGYVINDINEFQNLYKIRFRKSSHKKVAESIAIDLGDNADFLNPKYPGLPLNESLSAIKPIIRFREDLYLFAFNLLTRNLFSITEKLILDADKVYYNKKFLGNSFPASRDNYLERKTADLFKKFIPNAEAHLNLKYRPGQLDENGNKIETELDLLILSKNANYIIEMKAGGLSAPSKRGALKSLKGQLTDTVGYGAYQSYRAHEYLIKDATPEFYDKKGSIVNIDKTKKTFRITITLEHLSGYIAGIHDLKILGILKNDIDFAWTCSLYDLMIFSEILENENDFVDYLTKRIPLYTNPKIKVDDEIDFLGYFLETGQLIDKKALNKVSDYKLNKTSGEIDSYFLHGGKKPTKKPANRKL